jgi:hypothetical protein
MTATWRRRDGKNHECDGNPTISEARRAFPGKKRQPAGTVTVLSAHPWLLLPHVDRRHPFAAARRRLLLCWKDRRLLLCYAVYVPAA